jgi:ribosomal protein S18 acetylase RimI-like enzyme
MEPLIQRGASEDAAPLSALALRAKGYWGYSEEWLEAWKPELTLSPTDIRRMHVHVARVGGRIAGFYALHGGGRTLSLEHLWVGPEDIGRGVGRALLLHALKHAADRGAKNVEIESDPNAEGFYLRLGARRVGWRSRPVAGTARRLPLLLIEVDTAP